LRSFTNRQKADEAKREVAMRKRVYPRRVEEGRMTQADCDRQIAIMADMQADYAAKAEEDEKGARLI